MRKLPCAGIFFLAVFVVTARTNLVARAPASTAMKANPYAGSDSARRSGQKIYLRECAACHGQEREGRGKAPPLNRLDLRNAPAGSLFWVLRNGDLRRGMPSFAHLPEGERWQIVTFLQSGPPRP